MQVGVLGPLEVRTGAGELIPVAGARLRALLILLALAPSRMVGTERLVEALWGDQPPAGAGNALQALVSRLRRAVPGIVVVPQPAGYRLDLEPDRVDAVRFERLAAAGRARLRDDPRGAAATLREALALWRGPALADVAREDFARATIVRLDELRLTAIEDRVDADLRVGADAGLVAELDGLVAAYPLREPLVARFIRALDAAGRRAEALDVYERTRRRIADQLGVAPSAELAALHLAMLRGQPDPGRAAPPPRPEEPDPGPARSAAEPGTGREPAATGATARTNLRAERTELIGRDDDLAQVGKLLRAHRMTTLTGPGGAGKTRLASAAARAALDAMPDGVWLVELAPVTDPAEVAPATLDALGLRQLGRRGSGPRVMAGVEESGDPADRLVAALSDKQALLVLDNCEHLIDAAAALANRILSDCPRVTLMATSREPLSIGGEMLCPVQPLALPPEAADPALVTGYASVRLLTERARAVRPGFEINSGNALAVARICRALDGMPLAIELAAARLNAMTPQQVASRLDDRFRLLTGGDRTALARHRALAAVVGWSWDLLDDAERALWRRLSVFAGGATLEAVEGTCAADPVGVDRVLDLLAALVDKSLLEMREDGGAPRYHMLEIIKAYGHDRLVEAGELDAMRRAHAEHFLELAESAQDHLLAAEQLEWLARLSADHDNLHAAVREVIAAGDTPTACRFIAALGLYWWLRGHKIEGAELASAVLSLPDLDYGEAGAVPEAAVSAYTLGALLAVDSRYNTEAALTWFRTAARLVDRIPAPRHPVIRLVGPLAHVFETSMTSGEPTSLAALDSLTDDPFPWTAATTRMIRAHLALNYGHSHADAEVNIRIALERYQALGERWGISFASGTMGSFALWRGRFAEAADWFRQALAAINELGGPEEQIQWLTQLARSLWLAGDRHGAREQLARAQRDARRLGLPEPRGWAAHVAGDLARLDGDLPLAGSELAGAARFAASRTAAPQLRAVIAASRTHLALAEHDAAAAQVRYAEAVAAATSSVDAPVTGVVLVAGADLALHAGDPAAAATLLGAGAGVRGLRDLSLLDDERVAAAARAALGDARFTEAYRVGRAATVDTWRELPGAVPARKPLTPGA